MCIPNSVFVQCDVCGRNIYYGNAILEIARNVEQPHYEDFDSRKAVAVIESEPLITLCACCGNILADRKEVWKYLASNLGLPVPANNEDNTRQPGSSLPEICSCCGVEFGENRARVSVVRFIGQMDWSEELNEDELIVIDAEDVLSLCPDCDKIISPLRLKQAFDGLIDYLTMPGHDENYPSVSAVDDQEQLLYKKKVNLLQRALARADEMDHKQGVL
ncbi:MAG TPA: hypothetical protein PLN25_07000 [Deltaproteobacteria bacterium]|nr:hypothetical protein [Deltaproteobacteria bacterium]HQB39792.1 hypothetical protein [Deltaproteobacteria bacterium]